MADTSTAIDPNYTWTFDGPSTVQGGQDTYATPYAPQQMSNYDWASKAGFTGDPWITSGGGQDATTSINPAFQQWATDNGYQWGYGVSPTGYQAGYFKDGQPVSQLEGNPNAWKGDATVGAIGMGLLGGFGGIAAAGGAGTAAAAAPAVGGGAFLGEGVASGVPAWDAAAASSLAGPTAGGGAFLGEGVASGVPAWDAAAGISPELATSGAFAPGIGDLSGTGPMAAPGALPDLTAADAGTMVPPTGGGASGASGILDAAGPVDSIPEDMLHRALKSITGDPLRAAQVGLSGYGLAKQLGGRGSAQQQINAIAGPEKAVSNQLLQQFQAGQISGADAFAIQDFSQKQIAQVNDYYARAGLSNSSMHLDALNRVNQQAEQMRQQAVQNLLSGGLKAAGISDPTLMAGVNASLKQDQASQDAMARFLATLAQMNTPRAPAPAPSPATDTTGTPS